MIRITALLILFTVLSAFAESSRYWVFFADKAVAPGQELRALDEARALVSQRSLARRLKNGAPLTMISDLPVAQQYVDQVRATGADIRVASKWVNAVSVAATPAQLTQIEELSCVRAVRRFSQRVSMDPPRGASDALDSLEYGASYRQDELCRIPELHARGLSGAGVLLCMLDTGFETLHSSLDGLDYLAMRDFINNDSIVTNEAGEDSAGQFMHGTLCLSAAAGLDSGNIIGPAYGAQWMLAKTEYVPTETEVEEDYYVAGMEWADSAGADITSSSLGYIDWYDQSDMDGQTTVVTQAVTEAQRRGILVVTAQGNERGSLWNSVIAPADADSILAIGAVDSLGLLSGFSSPGPTADGRVKPDCATMGSDVFCANATEFDGYFRASGTSLATPIAAGIAALVMEANPEWTAQQVRAAILATASQAGAPDNDLGHGIVDAVAAADFTFDHASPRSTMPIDMLLSAYPNPVNGRVTLSLESANSQSGRFVLYDLLGREVFRSAERHISTGHQQISLDVTSLSSGKYFITFVGTSNSASVPVVVLK